MAVDRADGRQRTVLNRFAKIRIAAALLFALLALLNAWAQNDSDKRAQAASLNLLGTIRAQEGKLSEAETLFTRALRIDNRLVGAHLNLARLYLLKGAPEKTVAELKEALRLEPGNAEAAYRLGWVLFSLSC